MCLIAFGLHCRFLAGSKCTFALKHNTIAATQFWCEAQRLRFDKAWNLLWEMFRTKLLSWED